METITKGKLLIAEPFLSDPYFSRSVILLCEHQREGSFGFVLNRPLDCTLKDVVFEYCSSNLPVFYGGPVKLNSLFYIHQYNNELPDSVEIANGIYFGGKYEVLLEMMQADYLDETKIKFFIGYSGWEKNQLSSEQKLKTWLVGKPTTDIVFNMDNNEVWKNAVLQLGEAYKPMVNFPVNPQLN